MWNRVEQVLKLVNVFVKVKFDAMAGGGKDNES